GRWATLLARQAVTPARDQGEHEEKVFGEGEPEEADNGEKLNKGEVDANEYSEKAGGEAEISTTEEAENVNRVTRAIVHGGDNHDVDVDKQSSRRKIKAGSSEVDIVYKRNITGEADVNSKVRIDAGRNQG
ncbi:hypothetical protein MTO96_027663, partial [Rhipicephalus appendiculatus]